MASTNWSAVRKGRYNPLVLCGATARSGSARRAGRLQRASFELVELPQKVHCLGDIVSMNW